MTRDPYLRTDTHWTPAAMDRVAGQLAAEVIERLGPPGRPVAYERRPVRVSGIGDIARMLRLPPAAGRFPPQEVTIRRVTTPEGAPWRPERGAEVLLLGDSFTNVYSQDALGWGGGAGLAEQLAFHLRRPVDRIAVNAGGAHTTREALARAAPRRPGRLDGVRLVIYQFADRELSHGDWRPVDLSGGGPRARTAATAAPAEQRPVPGPGGAVGPGRRQGGSAEWAAVDWSGGPGRGFAVWESNRSGDWRLWTAGLDGKRPAPAHRGRARDAALLRPPLPGRDPAGLPGERGAEGPLPGDRGGRRAAADRARRAPERERAATRREPADARAGPSCRPPRATAGGTVRRSGARDDELIHVGGDGRTFLLELSSGDDGPVEVTARRALTTEPRKELGWLIDATLGHATAAAPTFSVFDADGRRVLERSDLGGCEPYFTHDGRWGFWVPGAGGPVDRIDLATRQVSTILHKSDPRLGERGYVYFPMVSRDGRLLAFGASTGEHSHFEADYDIFVMPTDPETLAVLGPPVRITSDPSTDRYPDVHLDRPSPAYEAALRAARSRPPGAQAVTTPGEAAEGASWPPARDRLVFLWQTGDSPNLVAADSTGPAQGGTKRGAARVHPRAAGPGPARPLLPHGGRPGGVRGAGRGRPGLAGRGGRHQRADRRGDPDPGRSRRRRTSTEMGRIVTFSSNRSHRNFTLGQVGNRLVARVRTGPTGANADRPQVELFEVEPGVPVHVAVTYTPGRLVAYRDGEPVVETDAVRGSISPQWRFRQLLFGGEWGDQPAGRPPDGGDWRGTLEGVAIYSRALAPATIRASAERYRRIVAARPEIPRWRVRVRREATSEIPTLRQISPYRRALAVVTYRVLERLDGAARPGRPGRPGPSGWRAGRSSTAPPSPMRGAGEAARRC